MITVALTKDELETLLERLEYHLREMRGLVPQETLNTLRARINELYELL